MKLLKICLVVIVVFSTSACGKGKYEKMSLSELKEKQRHCDSIPKKSAVFANGCAKVEEEIKKRRKNRK